MVQLKDTISCTYDCQTILWLLEVYFLKFENGGGLLDIFQKLIICVIGVRLRTWNKTHHCLVPTMVRSCSSPFGISSYFLQLITIQMIFKHPKTIWTLALMLRNILANINTYINGEMLQLLIVYIINFIKV